MYHSVRGYVSVTRLFSKKRFRQLTIHLFLLLIRYFNFQKGWHRGDILESFGVNKKSSL